MLKVTRLTIYWAEKVPQKTWWAQKMCPKKLAGQYVTLENHTFELIQHYTHIDNVPHFHP